MYAHILHQLNRLSVSVPGLYGSVVKTSGSTIYTNSKCYIDFFSASGRLNYGHNNHKLLNSLLNDQQLHEVSQRNKNEDIKRRLLSAFDEYLIQPRKWRYSALVAGPSGACALEDAINIARKVTGRNGTIAFAEGFHGVKGISLSGATANIFEYLGLSADQSTVFMPYDRCLGPDVDTMACLEQWLLNTSKYDRSKIPAAVVVETVLGQGSVSVLTWRWLKDLEQLCKRYGMLLILDDTHVGCGRTGRFFSFESASVEPDIIVLTKSLSGFGLPLSMLLIHDSYGLAQNYYESRFGYYKSTALASLTAIHALQTYWHDDAFALSIQNKEILVRDWLENLVHSYSGYGFSVRGRGLIQGLVMPFTDGLAKKVADLCFHNGIIIDTSGINDEVLKLQPALTIETDLLIKGLELIESSLAKVISSSSELIRSSVQKNSDQA